MNFWVQKANIPGFSLPATKVATPFVDLPFPGDHIDFDTLDVLFSVDENMSNYLELYAWVKSLGYPEKYEQYAELLQNPEWTSLATKSEIVLTIMSNGKNPAFHVVFHDAFPIGLSSLDFDSRLSGTVPPVPCAVSFMYSDFDIERVLI